MSCLLFNVSSVWLVVCCVSGVAGCSLFDVCVNCCGLLSVVWCMLSVGDRLLAVCCLLCVVVCSLIACCLLCCSWFAAGCLLFVVCWVTCDVC